MEGENLDLSDVLSLRGEFAESSLPYEVDLVIRSEIVNPELEKRIKKQGTMIYEKWQCLTSRRSSNKSTSFFRNEVQGGIIADLRLSMNKV